MRLLKLVELACILLKFVELACKLLKFVELTVHANIKNVWTCNIWNLHAKF